LACIGGICVALHLKIAYDRLLGGRLLQWAGSIIATSDGERAALVAEGISPGRVSLRANGVDVGDLLPLPARGAFRSRLGIGPEAPVALVLARIYALKGLNHFADAIALIPGAVGVVAGRMNEMGPSNVFSNSLTSGLSPLVSGVRRWLRLWLMRTVSLCLRNPRASVRQLRRRPASGSRWSSPERLASRNGSTLRAPSALGPRSSVDRATVS